MIQLSLDFGIPAPLSGPERAGPTPEVSGDVLPLPGTEDLYPEFRLVSPDEIQADPHQTRRNFPREGLLDLAASIARVGLIEPLVVEENRGPGKRYVIIAGERRHRAIMLGRELWPDNPHFREVRCLVYPPLPGEVRAAFQLEENLKRSGLSPYEIAAGLHQVKLCMAKSRKRSSPAWDEVLAALGISPGKETRKWLR
ncbi:ParB N-terminal domain-containing protein [Desulfofundulus sp. TPOSR]|uniref:ParB/RepB/Spo0J family partition protein n=1 Tax=Desulfofundulus sp. TPOSR TaxID=2714340 RepID=UPI001408DFB9|nr:ParB N-terminal domain-containing protein [Desulfofundulus sp. TPOSR]NHM27999.1 ParB N-terminal domain-containing protein [Desulfofundulus sp. TPOSR]